MKQSVVQHSLPICMESAEHANIRFFCKTATLFLQEMKKYLRGPSPLLSSLALPSLRPQLFFVCSSFVLRLFFVFGTKNKHGTDMEQGWKRRGWRQGVPRGRRPSSEPCHGLFLTWRDTAGEEKSFRNIVN